MMNKITEAEELACAHYICHNNASRAYLMFRELAGMGELRPSSVGGQASRFFKQDKIVRYLEMLEKNVRRSFKLYEAEDIMSPDPEVRAKIGNKDLTNLTTEEIRSIALEALFYVKDNQESSPSDITSAVRAIIDIENAKRTETPLSESEKYIHYVLPADVCEGCERREEIYEEHGYPATQEEIEEAFYSNRIKELDEDGEEKTQ